MFRQEAQCVQRPGDKRKHGGKEAGGGGEQNERVGRGRPVSHRKAFGPTLRTVESQGLAWNSSAHHEDLGPCLQALTGWRGGSQGKGPGQKGYGWPEERPWGGQRSPPGGDNIG